MELVKGTVEQISIKDPNDGQYGRWANYGIKVSGTWHNGKVTEDKFSKQFVVKDKEYKEITVGSEVEFIVEETTGKDGKVYKNINAKTMTLKGGAQQAPPPTTEHPTQQPIRTSPPITKEPLGASLATHTLWNDCVRSAVMLAKGTTFQCGDKAPEQFTSEQVMRVAQGFFDEMLKK